MSILNSTKTRPLILPFNYCYLYYALSLFVFLSTFVAYKSVHASTVSQPVFNISTIGIQHRQLNINFDMAQTAFEEQEYVFAFRLMQALAENGHTQAQYFLATQYDTGLGVGKDEFMAYRWYKKAAIAGMRTAQHNLAVAYAQGIGVIADLKQAVSWWERAAKQGHTDSQFNLGIVYATGKGVIEPDMAKALKWWHMAAINGDAAAQFNLGALYANGLGNPATSCEAVHWLKKSEKNGFKQAHTALSQIQQLAHFTQCK